MTKGCSVPLKKVRPEPKSVPGQYPFYCDVCVVEWLLKINPAQVPCAYCGKILAAQESK